MEQLRRAPKTDVQGNLRWNRGGCTEAEEGIGKRPEGSEGLEAREEGPGEGVDSQKAVEGST